MGLDYSEFEQLLKNYEDVQKEFLIFLKKFMLEMGLRVLAQTQNLTPVDSGNLREKWEISDVYVEGDDLLIALFNPVEYASHVEDGHMQYKRFVPGEWQGDKFKYIKGHKKGMVLNEKFIPGFHMARISITKVEKEMPARFNKAFSQFMKRMGVS